MFSFRKWGSYNTVFGLNCGKMWALSLQHLPTNDVICSYLFPILSIVSWMWEKKTIVGAFATKQCCACFDLLRVYHMKSGNCLLSLWLLLMVDTTSDLDTTWALSTWAKMTGWLQCTFFFVQFCFYKPIIFPFMIQLTHYHHNSKSVIVVWA